MNFAKFGPWPKPKWNSNSKSSEKRFDWMERSEWFFAYIWQSHSCPCVRLGAHKPRLAGYVSWCMLQVIYHQLHDWIVSRNQFRISMLLKKIMIKLRVFRHNVFIKTTCETPSMRSIYQMDKMGCLAPSRLLLFVQ